MNEWMNEWMKVSRWWHITELDVNNPRGFGVVVLSSSFSQWNFSATLSAAFDHIDHSILLSRIHHTFGVSGIVLSRLQTDLSGETLVVSMNDMSSDPAAFLFLRGLGSPLHSSYFWSCIWSFSESRHFWKEQTIQVCTLFSTSWRSSLSSIWCFDVKAWMKNSQLQLNNWITEKLSWLLQRSSQLAHQIERL